MAHDSTAGVDNGTSQRKDRTHLLYIAVIAAVVLGIAVGFAAPDFAVELKPLGDGFVALIRMMIAPVIFCTIVLGIGSLRSAAQVGKVGSLALVYFLTMSTVALVIGLVVGNIIHPGEGLRLTEELAGKGAGLAPEEATTTAEFILNIIPETLFSALTTETVLQTLLVALLVGFAIQAMGTSGKPILVGIGHLQRLVFRILSMIMWVAPIGAFGAIAAVVGATGLDALKALAVIMIGFYVTCAIFVFGILGLLLKAFTGINIFKVLRYLGREFLLIVSTSSSESALPRLIAKMEHLGVAKPTVGVVVPTGYSFNLDGTAIYLTMSSLFIAAALGDPLTIPEQISLLVFMMIASKGAAGVTGAGLATLAGGLASHRPDLVDGVGLIVGIVLEEVAVVIAAAEQVLGHRLVAAGGNPGRAEIAAADMRRDRHVRGLGFERLVDGAGIGLLQVIDVEAAIPRLLQLLLRAEIGPGGVVELQIAAACVVECAHRLLVGDRQVVENGVATGIGAVADRARLETEMHHGRARDGHFRQNAGVGLEELEMLQHRMIGEADLSRDANALGLGLHALKLDAMIELVDFDAVEHAEEIEMPERAAELAVSRQREPDVLLLLDDLLDLAVLQRLELRRR